MDPEGVQRRPVTPRTPLRGDVDGQLRSVGDVDTAVLVEGASDREAVVTLARRRGVDLPARSVQVVAMGGITNIGRFVEALGPPGRNLRLAGLFDVAEQSIVTRALIRHGVSGVECQPLGAVGFYPCDRDLEDELIRAVGVDGVQEVLAGTHELTSFRLFQNQPAQREVAIHDQLRRFLGTRATRKFRLAAALAEAVPLAGAPPPIVRLLDRLDECGPAG